MQLLLVHSGLQGVRIWRRGLRWTPWFAFPFRSQGASARDHVDVMQDRAPPGDPGPRSLSRGRGRGRGRVWGQNAGLGPSLPQGLQEDREQAEKKQRREAKA